MIWLCAQQGTAVDWRYVAVYLSADQSWQNCPIKASLQIDTWSVFGFTSGESLASIVLDQIPNKVITSRATVTITTAASQLHFSMSLLGLKNLRHSSFYFHSRLYMVSKCQFKCWSSMWLWCKTNLLLERFFFSNTGLTVHVPSNNKRVYAVYLPVDQRAIYLNVINCHTQTHFHPFQLRFGC